MSSVLSYALALGAVVLLLAAVAAIRKLGQRFAWHAEVQRKGVHVLVGAFAITLPFFIADRGAVVALVVLAILVMLGLRWRPTALGGAGAAIHSVERRSFGDIWLAVAIGFLFVHADGRYILYGLPLAIITLSDAAAALTGSSYGRRRFATEDGVKSWEGVVAFTMVGWVTAMAMLLLFSAAARGNVILLGFIVAAFGAMVEAVSWRGLDNLFVPLALHFFLAGFLGADVLTLALIAAGFFAAAGLAVTLAKPLALAPQTARAFVVALFVFVGVGDPFGAIVPFVAIVAYLLTRRASPAAGKHPDLDFLGTLCATALIWYFIGETAGPSAIHHYNLAMTGIAAAYAMLGFRTRGRIGLALLVPPALFALLLALTASGLHPIAPPPTYPIVSAASLLLVAAAVLLAPAAFRRWRAPRIALLASIVPLCAYFKPLVMP